MKGIERLGLLGLEIEAKRHGRLSLQSFTTEVIMEVETLSQKGGV